jgi:DNA-directed RNA polymerase subunit beta
VAIASTSRERYSFANLVEPIDLPDLIAIQRSSFEWFLNEGLANTFRDISPIKDFSESLQLELEFDPFDEDLRPPPKFSVEECKEKDMTYSAPVFVRARFMNRNTGEIKEQTVFMGDFPIMTEKGTFIVNGTERVVVSQLVRSPGVIFEPGERYRLRNLTKHQLVKGTIHPYRGEWMEFDVEQKPGRDVTAGTRVARKRRLGIFTLLRALGYDEEHAPGFLDRFVAHFDFLQGQWDKERDVAPTEDEALVEIYKRARPGEPPTVESARAYFRNAFFESRRYDPAAWAVTSSTASWAPRWPGSASCSAFPANFSTSPTRSRTCSVAARSWRRSPTCSTSSSRSRATASTTRTTSPTGASARSVN